MVGGAVRNSLRRICRRGWMRFGPLAVAGADFVAVGDDLWDDPRGAAAALAEAAMQLAAPETAA